MENQNDERCQLNQYLDKLEQYIPGYYVLHGVPSLPGADRAAGMEREIAFQKKHWLPFPYVREAAAFVFRFLILVSMIA